MSSEVKEIIERMTGLTVERVTVATSRLIGGRVVCIAEAVLAGGRRARLRMYEVNGAVIRDVVVE